MFKSLAVSATMLLTIATCATPAMAQEGKVGDVIGTLMLCPSLPAHGILEAFQDTTKTPQERRGQATTIARNLCTPSSTGDWVPAELQHFVGEAIDPDGDPIELWIANPPGKQGYKYFSGGDYVFFWPGITPVYNKAKPTGMEV